MLPKISLPSTICHLPVTQKDVKVHAFNLGEEKSIILAKEAGSNEEVERALVDMIQRSVSESFRVEDLPAPDITALFIAMVGISKGTRMDAEYTCHNEVDGKVCGKKFDVSLDIQNYHVSGKVMDGLIKVDDTVMLHLVYPSLSIMQRVRPYEGSGIEHTIRLFAYCIQEIYNGDEVITEFSDQEIYEWVLSLPESAVGNAKEFFELMPSLDIDLTVKCPKCGHEEKRTYRNLNGFFTLDMEGQTF